MAPAMAVTAARYGCDGVAIAGTEDHVEFRLPTIREPIITIREPIITIREPIITIREPIITIRVPYRIWSPKHS